MDFVDKVKDFMDKSAVASKNVIEKAGSAVQDFSDKSVLKIEIKQLELKKTQNYTKLGEIVSEAFLAGEDIVSLSSEKVKEVFEEIKSIDAEILKKQSEISADKS